jgi:hypothetical protein
LSFWHIAEFANGEVYGAFQPTTAVDVGLVEVRAAEPDSDQFGAWERVVPDLNSYDGTRDTFYTTPTYEPPDDVNPADPADPFTTTCFPLTVYVSQGSAKGTVLPAATVT